MDAIQNNIVLYNLSQKIINNSKNCFFSEAYNVSYTDVYDFASAGNKKSLKKLEIEMGNISEKKLKKKGFSDAEIRIIKAGTHHQELGLPWDEPVPEELWTKVAEYCDNDVIATEAAFVYLKADWTARQILADLAGMTVNDTTNTLTQKIIFGNERKPQSQFNYRNLAEPVHNLDKETHEFLINACETKSVSSSLYLDMNEGYPDVSKLEKELSKYESDYKKGLLSDTTFEANCNEIVPQIAEGHNYRFIGKVGQFCPIKDGCGGGLLMREKGGKYYAATGSKGYRWLESEMVRELEKGDDIDRSY